MSPATGESGTEFTITLTNWTGAGWLTFGPAGAANTTYGPWVYVSSLPSAGGTKTWRVTPPTGGSYEARLYSDGFTRAATSSPFTVGF